MGCARPRRPPRHGMPLAAQWPNNSEGILKLADTRPRNLKPRLAGSLSRHSTHAVNSCA